MSSEIGAKIRQARKKAGLKQRELAEKIGVSESRISQYEKGVQNPRIDTLQKIADGLGITPFDLIGPEWFDLQAGPEKLAEIRVEVSALKAVETAYGEPASQLVASFSELNETGQKKALDYVFDLAEQPKYQK